MSNPDGFGAGFNLQDILNSHKILSLERQVVVGYWSLEVGKLLLLFPSWGDDGGTLQMSPQVKHGAGIGTEEILTPSPVLALCFPSVSLLA